MKKKTKSPRVQIKELTSKVVNLTYDKDYLLKEKIRLCGEVEKYKKAVNDRKQERLLGSMERIIEANAHLTMYVSKIVAKEIW